MSKDIEIKVADGGMLSASLSSENVGEANYIEKTNLRREEDQEIRREGWKLFKPSVSGSDVQSIFDGTDTVIRFAELVRPNGERVVVGASRTEIKRFDTTSGLWTTIGSGYSPLGKRWQVETMDGYLILNNAVDLMCSYRVEHATVTPLYELREVGVASVGRMRQNSGYLLLANIREIQGDQLDHWMAGYSSYVATSVHVRSSSFEVLDSDSGKLYEVSTVGGAVAVALPINPSGTFFIRLNNTNGSSVVVATPTISNQEVSLNVGDSALIWYDAVRAKYAAKVFAGGVVPTTDPYGPVPDDIVNHLPWVIVSGEFGKPRNWAPKYELYLPAATNVFNLPFASALFKAGDRVGVDKGGPDEGMLGGDTGNPDGILVTSVVGNVVTLAIGTNTGISYPRRVILQRWTDVSTTVVRYSIQGDSSPIIGLENIVNLIIVYRGSMTYVGRHTGIVVDGLGNTKGPFTFRPHYEGPNIPRWGDCIISVNGDYHLYPSGDHFYQYDGQTFPEIHVPMDRARKIFFTQDLSNDEEIWAVDNPATHEAWIIRPGVLTLAFDYQSKIKTPSVIDVGFDAAGLVQRPGNWLDKWFILGIGRIVSTYGLVDGQEPLRTWLRNGQPVGFALGTGLTALKDQANEKDLHSYTPILSSFSPDYRLKIQVFGTHNPSAPSELLFEEDLPDPQGNNYITAFFRALYFRVRIYGLDTRDIDFRLSHQLWTFDKVMAGGVTRSNA